MNNMYLTLGLKFLGGLIVGASLMHWLGKPIDGMQVFIFAIGLAALFTHPIMKK